MAQKRFIQHLDSLTSFEANEEFLGIFEPGRLRGFDAFVQQGPLDGDLIHTITGIQKTEIDNSTQTPAQGLNITKQGTFVYETALVPISGFGSNAGNAFDRIDLIIMDHDWLVSAGGQAAVYSIIQGADGGPVIPDLTDIASQTIVGQMLIPANDANLNDAVYTPAVISGLGGTVNAYLNQPQIFTRPQSFGYSALDYGNDYVAGTDTLTIPGLTGNHYSIALLTTDDLDILVTPLFNNGATIKLKITQTGTAGFITETGNITLPGENTTHLISSGAIYEFFTEDNVNWELVSVSKNASTLTSQVLEIGIWNMDTTGIVTVAHTLTLAKIRSVDVMIEADSGSLIPFHFDLGVGGAAAGSFTVETAQFVLDRLAGGTFDDVAFSGAANNRGWITIWYED